MCNLVQDLHLTQLVNEHTRGNHILDLVLASTPDLTSNVRTVDSLPGSDHHSAQFDLKKRPPSHPALKRQVFIFKCANFDDFRTKLSCISWDFVREISDINQAWTKWKNTFLAAARDTVPLLVWKPGQRNSWLTMDTRKLIKKKRRAYRRAKKTKLD